MKCLILNMDCVGEGLPFALRCARAGHAVKLWLSPENHPETGLGFRGIERVKTWLPHVSWADLIVPTGNHLYLSKLDAIRKDGARVFGPTMQSAALEIQRAQGMKFFEKCGIKVPKYQQFNSLGDAEAHVRKTEERYVFKTLGDEDDKSLSYVAKSPADMVARLQRWQKLKMNPKGPVMLQEFIAGVELGVSQWTGQDGFVGLPNESFEHKKLLSGDCGPNCGEAGTVIKYVEKSKLCDTVLSPCEDALKKLGHTGDAAVNCIIDDKGQPWPLEWTMRLGWPYTNIAIACHKGDPVQWMWDACEGKDTFEASTAHACGVVIAQPDYPYSKATKAEVADIPIYGITQENERHIAPQAVKIAKMPAMDGEKLVERDIWTTTGDYVAVATARGKTVKQACERAYKNVKDVHIPNMIYRDDVGEKLKKEIPELKKHGYVDSWVYE